MKTKFKKKQNTIFRISVVVVLIWFIGSLISLQSDIKEKRLELEELRAQIVAQQYVNEELESKNANDAEYLEQQARNKGLAKPGEIIYKEIPGN